MTTLTKARLLDVAKVRCEKVEVEGFGEFWIRSQTPLRLSQRVSSYFDDTGKPTAARAKKSLHDLIDQVCEGPNKPMFTDADLPELEQLDVGKLEPLIEAVSRFNGENDDELKKPTAGSTD